MLKHYGVDNPGKLETTKAATKEAWKNKHDEIVAKTKKDKTRAFW